MTGLLKTQRQFLDFRSSESGLSTCDGCINLCEEQGRGTSEGKQALSYLSGAGRKQERKTILDGSALLTPTWPSSHPSRHVRPLAATEELSILSSC